MNKMEKEIKTKNTIIHIDSIQHYVGLIPVLSGKITVLPQAIELKLKGKQTEAMQLAKEAFKWYTDDLNNSFFIYGFHISMPYIDVTKLNYFKLDFGNYHNAETIRIAYIYLTKMCIQFNRAIEEAEKVISKYQRTVQEAINELKKEKN
jgi:hypothetical protein